MTSEKCSRLKFIIFKEKYVLVQHVAACYGFFFFVIVYEVYFGSVCRDAVKTFEESVSVCYVHTSSDEISLGNLFMNVEYN